MLTSNKKLLYAGIVMAFAVVMLVLPALEKASIRRLNEKRLQEGFKGYIANKFIIGSPYIVIIKEPSKETIFLNTVSNELYHAAQPNDSVQKYAGENAVTISRQDWYEKLMYMAQKPD